MSKFIQDFSGSHLKSEYKLIDGHVVEVGKIDLQELYNSMLPNSLDSILKAFLEPQRVSVADQVVCENGYQSFDDLVDSVNTYAELNGLEDKSFSEILNIMISPVIDKQSNPVTVVSGDVSSGGENDV